MINYEKEYSEEVSKNPIDRLDFGIEKLKTIIIMRRRKLITKKEYREKLKEIELFLGI